jgi:glucan 1,3-beta-glucosidase
LAAGQPVPGFSRIMARFEDRLREPLPLALGATLIVVSVLALTPALGLVFDPRYRDFAFAPLSSGVAPYATLAFLRPSPGARRGQAEKMFAAALLICVVYIVPNESFANWQALWFAAPLVVLAFTLLRLRDAPG